MAESWVFTREKVEAATQVAKQRVAEHWARKEWYLWKRFDSAGREVNPNWVDPVFENEWTYLENNPNTNPANIMTINAYIAYCWYKYKGYSDITIAALLYSHTVESKISGGRWESLRSALAMHPYGGNAGNWLNVGDDGVGHASYDALIGFAPTASIKTIGNNWYLGPSKAPPYTFKHDQWSDDDGVTISDNVTILTCAAGSYDSVRGPSINEAAIQHSAVQQPDGTFREYYHWRSGVPKLTYTKGTFGYGLVQWTEWFRLREKCGWLSGSFKSTRESGYTPGYDPKTITYYTCGPEWWTTTGNSRSQGFAHYHWQLNLILHLMVLEFERANAMRASPVVHPNYPQPNGYQYTERDRPGSEGVYYGEWTDASASSARWNPYGINPSPGLYRSPCTWDSWASGDFLNNPNMDQDLINELNNDPDPPYRQVRLAMDIFRHCYLHTGIGKTLPYPDAVSYWINCCNYWKDVWSINDIPRPREFPWLGFELDYYHQKRESALLIAGRRKQHARRALLF